MLATKEFWLVVATLVTLIATLYSQYLSKRAKEKKAQESRYVKAADREKGAQVSEAKETILANETIKKQNVTEDKFFGGVLKNPMGPEIWIEVNRAAMRHKLDSSLVAAVVMVESAGNRFAMRFEPLWKYVYQAENFSQKIGCTHQTEEIAQSTSWGLMQVMGTVAREYGHTGFLSDLCEVEKGLEYGCLHLSKKISKYGELPGIAAYNAGSPSKDSNGAFTNQSYVDKILEWRGEFIDVTRPGI